jgi:SAM-dependent methyltransferase
VTAVGPVGEPAALSVGERAAGSVGDPGATVGPVFDPTTAVGSVGDPAAAITRSLSFGAEAAAYERGRPSYPPEAIDWLLPRGARDVLDLGAGTGKLTTRLAERGLSVVAVDPIPEMLEVLRSSLPDTPALLGTAEEIPLPDASVDAVLVAQAWHWFDPMRAIPEVARVLRPGGRLGLVWNTRDERMGWVRDLGRIIGREHEPFSREVTLRGPFVDLQRQQVEWTSYLTPQALIDLVASRSYCITSPTEVRTRTLDEVRDLLATHPALANTTGLALPYVTVCVRATLAQT